MYHFIEAQHSTLPNLKYGFLLKISTFIELMDYIHIKQIPTLGKAFVDVQNAIEHNHHTSNAISQQIIALSKVSNKSVLDIIGEFSQDAFKGQMECLEFQPICFQKSGGWMPFSGVNVLSEKYSEEFIWPVKKILTMKDDVKITRWPGGNHYYVSVNEISLDKFNTIAAAEEVAQNYIDRHNRE